FEQPAFAGGVQNGFRFDGKRPPSTGRITPQGLSTQGRQRRDRGRSRSESFPRSMQVIVVRRKRCEQFAGVSIVVGSYFCVPKRVFPVYSRKSRGRTATNEGFSPPGRRGH